jgi:hypothetical protein
VWFFKFVGTKLGLIVVFLSLSLSFSFFAQVKMGQGIAGTVAQSGTSIIVNDPYNDERFDNSTDIRTGYTTGNMMTVPITTWKVKEKRTTVQTRSMKMTVQREIIREKCIIGVVQVLNKAINGGTLKNFSEDDLFWLEEWNTLIGVSLNQAHNHAKFLNKMFQNTNKRNNNDGGGGNAKRRKVF